jgi:cyclomaltodextrinase / maltogenic alpha-amylase / neopullulanase
MFKKLSFVAVFVCLAGIHARGQDSVDVTFRYTNTGTTAAYLVGEFNGWNNSTWPMTSMGSGLWTRTVRLPVGINPFSDPVKGIPGAWQYKFYFTGASSWPNDPLNHYQNAGDNNNSYVYVKNPTIYHLQPNQRSAIVATPTPQISAFLYPKVGGRVDTSTIRLVIDNAPISGIGAAYDSATRQFSYSLRTPLPDGNHVVILQAGSNSDTVNFTVLAVQTGYVRITTRGDFATRNPLLTLRGVIQNTAVASVKIVRNGTDTMSLPVTSGAFSTTATLAEGKNVFRAMADSNGLPLLSDPVAITYLVDHAPRAEMGFTMAGPQIVFYADGTTDPDSGETAQLKYLWRADSQNPSVVGSVHGNTTKSFLVTPPTVPGDYFFTLFVTDPEGNADTVRNYFSIEKNGAVTIQTPASNPAWARQGRIYFLFPLAVSQAGTLTDAASRLQNIKDMGFNIVWLMPIMKNDILDRDNHPGYRIIDFYNVADEYGGNAAFSYFMQQAHALGLKVILDITPNHTSRQHPWCVDAHYFKQDSRYWSWYEHGKITANTNNLGDYLDADGFNYYGGFTDQMMNYNWADIDARTEMINVYKYWITQFGVDGYRFDVYWGPHRRYGEARMGQPVRRALKHIKPDILLLGEDDGTGSGSEEIFADFTRGGVSGGVDAGYDFNLYGASIKYFGFSGSAITTLHGNLDNGGYYPGRHALYLRYMESQDEDRIVFWYSSNFSIDALTTFVRTMPMATVLFTAPGLPMIWNGQEVGFGYGITSSTHARNRSVINWNYQGRTILSPHYQKLATLRGQFPAFSQHKRDTNGDGQVNATDSSDFVRVSSSSSDVYAFSRPYENQNGLSAVNFTASAQTFTLDLTTTGSLKFTGGIQAGTQYYLNDLYSGTRQKVAGSGLNALAVTLPPYGSAVYTVSLTPDTLKIVNPVSSVSSAPAVPTEFALLQNYPNPFNPTTTINYFLPSMGVSNAEGRVGVGFATTLKLYDLLGREVAVLVDGMIEPGEHQVTFDASRLASGMYIYRFTAGRFSATKTMIFLR